jgi:hypothetical protein
MLTFSNLQVEKLDELAFYRKLGIFIKSACKKPSLIQWFQGQQEYPPLWAKYWREVKAINEHDAALVLIFLAVGECENQRQIDINILIESLAEKEIEMKQLLVNLEYFDFSDFDLDLSES